MVNSYISSRDPNKRSRKSGNAEANGPARNWYTVVDADLGAKELPIYGRAVRVRMSSTATVPLTMVVVPIGETDDASTRTLYIDASELLPFGVRRIVSLNGGVSVPAGVAINLVTA